MRRFFILITIAGLFASCGGNSDNNQNDDSTVVEEISEVKTDIVEIALADFDVKAPELVGKTIQVSGIADHICKHGGKKVFLVSDDANIHVTSDERFDEKIEGTEIVVTGIVKELIIDEAYLTKKEEASAEEHEKSHAEGEDHHDHSDDVEKAANHIQKYRDSMKTLGVDHLSSYSIEYVSHKAK